MTTFSHLLQGADFAVVTEQREARIEYARGSDLTPEQEREVQPSLKADFYRRRAERQERSA